MKLFRSEYFGKSAPLPEELKRAESETNLIERKIQELVLLLENTQLDKKQAKLYETTLLASFKKATLSSKSIRSFQELDADGSFSREELLEGLETLLHKNPVDSQMSKSYLRRRTFQRVITSLLAMVLVVLGFAMIIMPAPQSFELYTVFYFTPDDGVTIMDLVSLLIILGGVILLVTNLYKK